MNPSPEPTPTATAVAASNQHHRRVSCDWFRSPPTEYLNVSSVVYPRGAKVTLQDLDENNALVDVLYYRCESERYFPRLRKKDGAVITLMVGGDEYEDADQTTTSFQCVTINSQALVEAIRPALASVSYPVPDDANDCVSLMYPYCGLFFAQGRILETLKHGGLGAANDKLLRALVTVMKIVLKKTNHVIREMAAHKTIDYEHLWALFRVGSLFVTDIARMPHIHQLAKVRVNSPPSEAGQNSKEVHQRSYGFVAYGFDGWNFGPCLDWWTIRKFEDRVSVAGLEFRPLKFEERYADSSVTQKAIERGLKSLDYQSYHHCQYVGPAFTFNTGDGSRRVELNGRVIIDCLEARIEAPNVMHINIRNEFKIGPIPSKLQEMHTAIRSLQIKQEVRRPNETEQEKRKQFFAAHDEYLMLLKPVLPGWSLDHNQWFWLHVSLLEPVQFQENPLSRLVTDGERSMSLVNKVIRGKLKTMAASDTQKQSNTSGQRKNVLVHLSGGIGTGKSSTAAALVEHHQRPLLRLCTGDSPFTDLLWPGKGSKSDIPYMLELAHKWQAILVIDTVASIRDSDKRRIAHDLVRALEHFEGVGIVLRRNDEEMVEELVKTCQLHLRFETFTQEKREKIWRLLIDNTKKQESEVNGVAPLLNEETIRKMSEWELNGHEIQHFYENIVSLQQISGDEPLEMEDIEDLKNLSQQPIEPVAEESDTNHASAT